MVVFMGLVHYQVMLAIGHIGGSATNITNNTSSINSTTQKLDFEKLQNIKHAG